MMLTPFLPEVTCLMEFPAKFFGCNFLLLPNQHQAGYSLWRHAPHGTFLCVFVGLNLQVKLIV